MRHPDKHIMPQKGPEGCRVRFYRDPGFAFIASQEALYKSNNRMHIMVAAGNADNHLFVLLQASVNAIAHHLNTNRDHLEIAGIEILRRAGSGGAELIIDVEEVAQIVDKGSLGRWGAGQKFIKAVADFFAADFQIPIVARFEAPAIQRQMAIS